MTQEPRRLLRNTQAPNLWSDAATSRFAQDLRWGLTVRCISALQKVTLTERSEEGVDIAGGDSGVDLVGAHQHVDQVIVLALRLEPFPEPRPRSVRPEIARAPQVEDDHLTVDLTPHHLLAPCPHLTSPSPASSLGRRLGVSRQSRPSTSPEPTSPREATGSDHGGPFGIVIHRLGHVPHVGVGCARRFGEATSPAVHGI